MTSTRETGSVVEKARGFRHEKENQSEANCKDSDVKPNQVSPISYIVEEEREKERG